MRIHEILNEQVTSNDVVVLGSHSIPDSILDAAEMDGYLSGVVTSNKGKQLSISVNDELVGFLTPRQEKNGVWRTGAIYILPEYRNKGYGAKAIKTFFTDKEKGMSLIEPSNTSSQRAFSSAGFVRCDDFVDKSDGSVYQIWKKGF